MFGLTSTTFWLTVLVLIGVRVFRPSPKLRAVAFLLATAALFWRPGFLPTLFALWGLALYGYVALLFGRGKGWLAFHTLVFSAIFAGSQHAGPLVQTLPPALRILPLVGLPYVYLRWLHLLIEVQNDRLPRPHLLEYLVYILPFNQIIAGPIERFAPFRERLYTAPGPLDTATILDAFDRITSGLVKKLVIAELLQKTTHSFSFQSEGWRLLAEVDLFALYIYVDFSGYMDIIIGAGILAGWRPPENFRWPFLSRNLIVFWERWHITLSEWIRDHIFTPANLALQRGPLGNWPNVAGTICYLGSMLFCGLWHRFDLQFALWGVLHGLGIIVCKQYGNGLKKLIGNKRMKAYKKSPVAAVFGGVVTFHFVAISFLFAFHPPARAIEILGRLF